MPESLGSWGDAIRGQGVEFVEFFSQTPLSQISGWDPVVKTMKSNDATSSFSGKTGAGFLQRFSDGSVIPSLNRYKLFDTSVAQEPVGGRIAVSRQTLLYRNHESSFNENNDLINAVKVYLSRAGAAIFNRAFTSGSGVTNGTRVVTYGDGVPLVSTVHPRADGGATQSNASATGIPLTEANFEIGRIALENQLLDDGVPVTGMGKLYLVVGTSNEKTATIIADSDKRSGTGNNDLNFYEGKVNVLVSKYLEVAGGTNATQWFIIAPSVAKLATVISAGPDVEFVRDKDTKSGLFDVILDLGVCSYDYRGVWGSLGGNAAYSS